MPLCYLITVLIYISVSSQVALSALLAVTLMFSCHLSRSVVANCVAAFFLAGINDGLSRIRCTFPDSMDFTLCSISDVCIAQN